MMELLHKMGENPSISFPQKTPERGWNSTWQQVAIPTFDELKTISRDE
jgi:hypothetical protein